jgi:uncharacterized protein YndB with AHSA1/START domain
MNDIEKRTLTLNRTFDAPRKLVWEAWTQPEHLAAWWGRGMPVKIVKHNFSVNGEWEFSMPMPDGNEFISKGVYSRIEAMDVIESSASFIPMTEGVTIVALFAEAGDKTDFTFKVIHDSEEYCQQQEQMGFMNGWGGVFDALAQHLDQ